MNESLDLALMLFEAQRDGRGLSKVCTLTFEGRCICNEPERYRRGFVCAVHPPKQEER